MNYIKIFRNALTHYKEFVKLHLNVKTRKHSFVNIWNFSSTHQCIIPSSCGCQVTYEICITVLRCYIILRYMLIRSSFQNDCSLIRNAAEIISRIYATWILCKLKRSKSITLNKSYLLKTFKSHFITNEHQFIKNQMTTSFSIWF